MKKEKRLPIYVRIQDIPKVLKEAGINISYRGMRHYINLGIFPRPIKIHGSKEKYYDPVLIEALFLIVKHMGGLFCLNHNEIKKIFSRQEGFAILTMGGIPIEFIMTYSKIMEKYKERWIKEIAYGRTGLPFSMLMSVSLERALNLYSKILLEEVEKAEKNYNEIQTLGNVVNARFKPEFIKYLDSHYKRMVKIYSMDYIQKLNQWFNKR